VHRSFPSRFEERRSIVHAFGRSLKLYSISARMILRLLSLKVRSAAQSGFGYLDRFEYELMHPSEPTIARDPRYPIWTHRKNWLTIRRRA
jgi:hypothetical protein